MGQGAPTPAPCAVPLWLAEIPNGQFCAGRRPVLCHRLGRGLQQLSPFSACQGRPSLYSGQGGQGLPLLYIQWAEPGGGWAGGPAVIAQGAADRDGHPQGSSICPEPLGPLARQSSRLGILPGPREQELCLCRGWAARPAPASWPRPSDGQFSAPGPPLAHRPAHSRLAQRCPS